MVDIHSHILYGLDDGARTLDESVALARMAAENGTTDIAATPHANQQYAFDPDAAEARICELRGVLGDAPRIHRGCDFHLSTENIRDALANPSKYALNNRRYVLVEFSDLLIPNSTADTFALMLGAGMIPIVTHPERNALVRGRAAKLKEWVEMGCRVQVTAGSLLGAWGRNAEAFAVSLIEEGLAHFVASDAHDAKYRTPSLREAFDFVRSRWSAETARSLFVVQPRAALDGVPFDGPAKPGRRKKWYQRLARRGNHSLPGGGGNGPRADSRSEPTASSSSSE